MSDRRRDAATATVGAAGVAGGGLLRTSAVNDLIQAQGGKEPKVHGLAIMRRGTKGMRRKWGSGAALGTLSAVPLAVGTTRFIRGDVEKAERRPGFLQEGLKGSAEALGMKGENALDKEVPTKARAAGLATSTAAAGLGAVAARGLMRGKNPRFKGAVAPVAGVLAGAAATPLSSRVTDRVSPGYEVTTTGVRRKKTALKRPSKSATVFDSRKGADGMAFRMGTVPSDDRFSKIALRTVYHGTDRTAVKAARKKGWQARNEGERGLVGADPRGPGIYVADKANAAPYARRHGKEGRLERMSTVGPLQGNGKYRQPQMLDENDNPITWHERTGSLKSNIGVKVQPNQVIDSGRAAMPLRSKRQRRYDRRVAESYASAIKKAMSDEEYEMEAQSLHIDIKNLSRSNTPKMKRENARNLLGALQYYSSQEEWDLVEDACEALASEMSPAWYRKHVYPVKGSRRLTQDAKGTGKYKRDALGRFSKASAPRLRTGKGRTMQQDVQPYKGRSSGDGYRQMRRTLQSTSRQDAAAARHIRGSMRGYITHQGWKTNENIDAGMKARGRFQHLKREGLSKSMSSGEYRARVTGAGVVPIPVVQHVNAARTAARYGNPNEKTRTAARQFAGGGGGEIAGGALGAYGSVAAARKFPKFGNKAAEASDAMDRGKAKISDKANRVAGVQRTREAVSGATEGVKNRFNPPGSSDGRAGKLFRASMKPLKANPKVAAVGAFAGQGLLGTAGSQYAITENNKRRLVAKSVASTGMTNKDRQKQAKRKRFQAVLNYGGGALGLGGLGLLGASKSPRLAAKMKKTPEQLKSMSTSSTTMGAGIGGLAALNFAGVMRQEAKAESKIKKAATGMSKDVLTYVGAGGSRMRTRQTAPLSTRQRSEVRSTAAGRQALQWAEDPLTRPGRPRSPISADRQARLVATGLKSRAPGAAGQKWDIPTTRRTHGRIEVGKGMPDQASLHVPGAPAKKKRKGTLIPMTVGAT